MRAHLATPGKDLWHKLCTEKLLKHKDIIWRQEANLKATESACLKMNNGAEIAEVGKRISAMNMII